jgi:hypothetical protein
VNGAVTAVDEALGHIEQVQELGGAQASKLNIVDLSLDRRELREQSITLVRDFQPYASPIAGVRKLADETTLEQIVRDRRHEGSAQKQMFGHAVDADVGLFDRQVPDRDQYRVLNSDEADPGCVTGADRFVPREKPEQAVDQATEVAVRSIDKEFRPRDGQRSWHVGTAAPRLCFRSLLFGRTRHACCYLILPDRLIAKSQSCQRRRTENASLLLSSPQQRQKSGQRRHATPNRFRLKSFVN